MDDGGAAWATVVAQGQNVRSCEVGDKVLFSPEDRYEVEVQGEDYVMLRERELHAVAFEFGGGFVHDLAGLPQLLQARDHGEHQADAAGRPGPADRLDLGL